MNNILTRILLFTAALMSLHAHGLTLNPGAGNLGSAIADPAATERLTVTGPLNLADFEFMMLEMPALKALDLSGATIAEYNGDATFTGRTYSPSGVLPAYALLGMQIETLALPATITAIEEGALAGTAIREIALPPTLKVIGKRAFADCIRLTELAIPENVYEIGEGAFKGCVRLKKVRIGGTPAAIAPLTFAGCTGLSECNIPFTVRSIGASAFNGCASLASLSFPATLTEIEERAFYGSGLRELDLTRASHLASIGDWAFANCPSLASASLPQSLTDFGRGAFFNDASLRLTSLPEATEEIPDFAFTGNAGCATMIENTNVRKLGAYSLADWRSVRVLHLPAELEELAEGAIADWRKLDTIKAAPLRSVPDASPDTWGSIDRSRVVLIVSEECKDMFLDAPEWNEFRVMTQEEAIAGTDAPQADGSLPQAVSAHLEGATLFISAPSAITSVDIYDPAGRSFSFSVGHDTDSYTIDTSSWNLPLMIVRIVLDDASTTIFKLSR